MRERWLLPQSDTYLEKYAEACFERAARNGDTDGRRLKSKSDNAGKSFCVSCVHGPAAQKLAAPRRLMLRFSIELFVRSRIGLRYSM